MNRKAGQGFPKLKLTIRFLFLKFASLKEQWGKGGVSPKSKLTIYMKQNKKEWYKSPLEKTILKRASKIKRRIARGKYSTKDQITSAKNSLYRANLKRRITNAERVFGDFLFDKAYFEFQKGFFRPYHRIVDFYLPEHNLIIEIDGGYHLEPLTKYSDMIKDEKWEQKRNMKTIRILNEEVFDGSFIKKLYFI